jgi:hypothetical protein
MRWRHATTAEDGARAVRFAWTASFLATLTLVAILAMAKSAQAFTVPAAPGITAIAAAAPPADEEAEASEGEELEAEECEVGEEEECEDEAGPEAPQECLLSSAEATIAASTHQAKVRLLVRYTTSTPTAVTVEYGLHGAKGSLFLGSEKKHFGSKGVLHLTRRLSEAQMTKVVAAKEFTVRFHVLAAPGFCHPFFDRQLDVRRATPGGLAWSESG